MKHLRFILGGAMAAGLSLFTAGGLAQSKVTTVPDAQVESNVLKALAANSQLAGQAITSNTVYGTVTLSGAVRDEDSRKLAETIVSRTAGVVKVVDELTLSPDAAATASTLPLESAGPPPPDSDNGSAPLLQSDGTMAPAQPAPPPSQASAGEPPSTQQQQQPAYGQQPPYNQQPPYGQPQPPYNQQPQYGRQQPPYNQQPYGRPPNSYPQQPYGQQPYGQQGSSAQPNAGPIPYGAQEGGRPVTVPTGALLRIRINQGLDSKHTQPGTPFEAVVLNDVVAGGFVAIPRGATVQGTVVDVEKAGALKGRGELSLHLTQVTLAGKSYPITSDTWSNHGSDKSAQSVNSALGLGAVGAIIGGVAGGGAGAAIGAGAGGALGLGASAASGSGQAYIPSEAILTFHLAQPAAIATVSQAEMDRLGYGVPAGAQMRRRYVRPVPYGYPVYYPRYPYPY